MHLPKLEDPLTDAEMEKLLKEMKAKNYNLGRLDHEGHGALSDIAVNCTKCGVVVLTEEESWEVHYQNIDPNCPVCDSENAKLDTGAALAWNHQSKKFVWAHLYP